jgi:hypothetical protein
VLLALLRTTRPGLVSRGMAGVKIAGDSTTRGVKFKYRPIDPDEPYTIRLLTILPKLQDDVHNTSPVRCSLTHVQISESFLAPGVPNEALVSRLPSVNFHALVRERPAKELVMPHTLGLVEDAKAGLDTTTSSSTAAASSETRPAALTGEWAKISMG